MPEFLILKCQGAMQAWGGHTYEDYRPSLIFPTRSAVVGLLGACLGISRQQPEQLKKLNDSFDLTVLANLRHVENRHFEDRLFSFTEEAKTKLTTDQIPEKVLQKLGEIKDQRFKGEKKFLSAISEKTEPNLAMDYKKILLEHCVVKRPVALLKITDYHTVLNARRADGGKRDDAIVSRREYLCDAEFTLALVFKDSAEYDLPKVLAAIKAPKYTPYLGRRSCPLQRPLFEAIVSAQNAQQALKKIETSGTLYSETPLNNAHTLQVRDLPLFGESRRFVTRPVYVLGG